MVRKIVLLFGMVLIFGISGGCAHTPKPANTALVAPGELAYEDLNTAERFRKYESVGIRPFSTEKVVFQSTNPDERPAMEDFKKQAAQLLVDGFLGEMKGNFYKSYGIIESDADASKYDLVITGVFEEFDRGNRATRYLSGAGWTSVRVKGTMKETATGKEIVQFRDAKFGKGGAFGGDSIDLLKDNAGEVGGNISDFLEEVY